MRIRNTARKRFGVFSDSDPQHVGRLDVVLKEKNSVEESCFTSVTKRVNDCLLQAVCLAIGPSRGGRSGRQAPRLPAAQQAPQVHGRGCLH